MSSQEEQKYLAQLLIDRLDDNEKLKTRLREVVADIPAARAEGERLLAEATTLIDEQNKKQNHVKDLWAQMHRDHAAAWKVYEGHRDRAHAAISMDYPGLRADLLLDEHEPVGRRPELNEMSTFYRIALNSPEILALLADVNLTAAKLQEGATLVDALVDLESTIVDAEGEQQQATQIQDKALEVLHEWRMKMYKRIEIVTEDAPQLREVVGIVVK